MRIFYFLLTALLLSMNGYANNVQITNVSIVNGGPAQIQVEFDLSWDNSWRITTGQANHDGVWVFFKYKTASGNWAHMVLTGTNNVEPSGVDIYQTTNFQKAGAIIHRSASNLGNGTVTFTNIRLGVVNTLPYDIDVKAFAIEMVFIPAPTTRPFFGDGDGTTESTNAFHYTNNTATTGSVVPMHCDPNALDDAELETDGLYVYSNDTIQTNNPLGPLDPFPTFKAFWCMKYEISQAGWRDFLNTLTYDQQDTRTTNPPNSVVGTGAMAAAGSSRMYVEIATPGVASTDPAVYGCDANNNNIYDEAADGEWVAAHFLLWADVAAYLDWSGLAPMSEFQFERACRGSTSSGPQPAILGEYAWGTNTIFSSTYTLAAGGTLTETASNAATTLVGNAVYSVTDPAGVVRSGIFATGTSSRMTSGASFFGVMEMSGNVNEYCIHVGSEAGRSCRFVPNGNGTISVNGNAQLSVGGAGFWPGMEGNVSLAADNTCAGTCEVTGYAGIRLRGGSLVDASSVLVLANRSQTTLPSTRSSGRGGRGVLRIQ